MIDLHQLHKQLVFPHVKSGVAAADFTMGNGNDTLWLSQMVSDARVYAFDIQHQALKNTRRLMTENGICNTRLILDSHANLLQYIHEPICIGLFNLGYLPRSDKRITTMRPSTMKAVNDAISILAPDGIIMIAVYPGHDEGEAEGEMLSEQLARLDRRKYCVGKFKIINSVSSPYFIFVESK